MIPDPFETLMTVHRPDPDMLDKAWPAAERVAMRDDIVASLRDAGPTFAGPGRRHRRQWVAAGGLIAACAAALLVAQVVLPSNTPGGSSPARAATLGQLAAVAAHSATGPVGPGQFGHIVDHSTRGSSTDFTAETWMSYDGDLYTATAGRPDADVPPLLHLPALPSPRLLAALPTDPARLAAVLRVHQCSPPPGPSGAQEFQDLAGLLRGDFASPALRGAALRVLEHAQYVTTRPGKDAMGRTALQVTYAAGDPDARQSIWLDPTTSALLEYQSNRDGSENTETHVYTHASTELSVPAGLRSQFGQPERGGRPLSPASQHGGWCGYAI